jgi:hypothetical protein
MNKELVKNIILKKGGTIIPTFERELCITFFKATGSDFITTIEQMVKSGELKKDFYRWEPKKYEIDRELDNDEMIISLFIGGKKRTRKLNKFGKVFDPIYYLPGYEPKWVKERETKRNNVEEDIKEMLQSLIKKRTSEQEEQIG